MLVRTARRRIRGVLVGVLAATGTGTAASIATVAGVAGTAVFNGATDAIPVTLPAALRSSAPWSAEGTAVAGIVGGVVLVTVTAVCLELLGLGRAFRAVRQGVHALSVIAAVALIAIPVIGHLGVVGSTIQTVGLDPFSRGSVVVVDWLQRSVGGVA